LRFALRTCGHAATTPVSSALTQRMRFCATRAHLRDAAGGDDTALRDHRDAIGERFGLFEVMRGEHDRAAIGDERADRAPHRLARLDVEADGGFVEEQQTRPSADRERELHAALLSAGQLSVAAIHEAVETGHAHAVAGVVRLRVGGARLRQQFADFQRFRQTGALQHDADAAPRGERMRRLAEQVHLAAVGIEQAEAERDRGRLAGAVRAEQRKQFAALHAQVQAVERGRRAVALDDIGELKNDVLHEATLRGEPGATLRNCANSRQIPASGIGNDSCHVAAGYRRPCQAARIAIRFFFQINA
jgi:hypothetical protein